MAEEFKRSVNPGIIERSRPIREQAMEFFRHLMEGNAGTRRPQGRMVADGMGNEVPALDQHDFFPAGVGGYVPRYDPEPDYLDRRGPTDDGFHLPNNATEAEPGPQRDSVTGNPLVKPGPHARITEKGGDVPRDSVTGNPLVKPGPYARITEKDPAPKPSGPPPEPGIYVPTAETDPWEYQVTPDGRVQARLNGGEWLDAGGPGDTAYDAIIGQIRAGDIVREEAPSRPGNPAKYIDATGDRLPDDALTSGREFAQLRGGRG